MALSGIASIVAVVLLSLLGVDVGDCETRNTIRLSLAWYAVALGLMLRLGPQDWAAATRCGRAARWCWTWGLVCFLIHMGLAFQFFHHWSHADAFAHTRAVSGVGEGIYVSYLFAVLWTLDALWWWLAPSCHAARSPWIDRLLHGFMLFVVFNGAVVFASGPIRWVALAAFLFLSAAWFVCTGRKRGSAMGGTG